MSAPFAGIGLRSPHYQQIINARPKIDWLEAHSENFFMKGGAALNSLKILREIYPISLHGIGLSLGSAEGINDDHLTALKNLVDIIDPFLVSEHLTWNQIGGKYLPDLLPVPYTFESLEIFKNNIDKTQNFLKREILIENPSSYLEFSISTFLEPDFMTTLAKSTGAKILLDVNNIFVSSFNHKWDAYSYIDAFPQELIKEIHLAGHSIKELQNNESLKIDTHDDFVCQEVWDLYEYACQKFGNVPTLIEWDEKLPTLDVLITEAHKIYKYCKTHEPLAQT